jgi:hypothetical protein
LRNGHAKSIYRREEAGMKLTEAASNVDHGRDPPSAKIVAFYEEQFHGDGQAWGLVCSGRHRESTRLSGYRWQTARPIRYRAMRRRSWPT